ncbi:MAG: HNH endonuclease family protein [Alphaproteobacteria bacterium]
MGNDDEFAHEESPTEILDETDNGISDELEEGPLNASEDGRVTLDKSDRSLSEFHRWYKQGRVVIDPEWQRNYVWDKPRASKLIESFLLDIPVPVVYLNRTSDGKYEVIDGLQRLTSVFDYFDNKYTLQRLDVRTDLNGKRFQELSGKDQRKLEDVTLRSFELTHGSRDIQFIVFERLNTGGIKLNDMEIRNCLYRGVLNDLVKDLADNRDFKSAVGQGGLSKRMQDRALVLRFLAFHERTYLKCQHGLKRFLNEFLDTYRNAKPEKIEEYRRAFVHAMKACVTVFGESGFRLKNETVRPGSKSGGEWATRLNMAIFPVVATSFVRYDLGRITRAADAIYEEYLDMINGDSQWVDRVRRASFEAARLEYTFSTWYTRLDQVLEPFTSNDDRRIFSRQLKREMFEANATCSLCGQRISLIDDAVLDHDLQYWRGGKTVPDNAQLAHRLCNLKKG